MRASAPDQQDGYGDHEHCDAADESRSPARVQGPEHLCGEELWMRSRSKRVGCAEKVVCAGRTGKIAPKMLLRTVPAPRALAAAYT